MKDGELIFGLMASLDKESYSFADLRYLTAPFHMSAPSLRTNLSRMSAVNLIQSSRKGRAACYCFADKGLRIKANVMHGFTPLNWNGWDGAFWGVIFSVPNAQGEARHTIRKKLTKYRFACLSPGFWIRPLHPNEKIPDVFRNILATGFCRLIRFYHHEPFTAEQASVLWNLEEVNRGFLSGISMLDKAEPELDTLSPKQAFAAKMTVGDALVNIISNDPMLPPPYLPAGWQGETIRERFWRFDSLATGRSKPYWEKIFEEEDAL